MKIFTYLSFFIFSIGAISAQESIIYTVNKEISSLEWIGKKVTGSHEGTIGIKSGSVTESEGKITKGKLIIDMKTIKITDIDDEKSNNKLKGHLVSSDFFGVKEFPTSKLVINSVTYLEDNNVELSCDLTIKGFTNKVKIPAIVLNEANKLVIVGQVDIDRTKFDIKYGSGSIFDNLGDKAISDDFTIIFKVAATR